jgi:hypothetical protein
VIGVSGKLGMHRRVEQPDFIAVFIAIRGENQENQRAEDGKKNKALPGMPERTVPRIMAARSRRQSSKRTSKKSAEWSRASGKRVGHSDGGTVASRFTKGTSAGTGGTPAAATHCRPAGLELLAKDDAH